jgi:chlorophyll(ide) b reductase
MEGVSVGLSSVGVHNLSPGLVLTDLLLKDSTPAARRFFNTLAEEPQTVAAALVPRIRAVQVTHKSIMMS